MKAITIFCALLLGLAGCGRDTYTDAVARDHHEGHEHAGEVTAEGVLNQLHVDNLKEIALAKVAVDKVERSEVKAFAEMLIKDHEAADERVKAVASEMGVTLKEEAAPAAEDMLTGEGAEFEKAFLDLMKKEHEECIKKLEEALEQLKDTPVAKLIEELLPTLKAHQEEASRLSGDDSAEGGEGMPTDKGKGEQGKGQDQGKVEQEQQQQQQQGKVEEQEQGKEEGQGKEEDQGKQDDVKVEEQVEGKEEGQGKEDDVKVDDQQKVEDQGKAEDQKVEEQEQGKSEQEPKQEQEQGKQQEPKPEAL